jgi:hypothetical protein
MDGVSFRRDDQILINGVALPDVSTPESFRHLYTLPEIAGQAELTLRDYAGRTLTHAVTISPAVAPTITTIPDRITLGAGPGTVSFTIADHGTVLATKSVQVTTAGPVVSTITPPCAAFDGGSLVTISGSGFEDGAVV